MSELIPTFGYNASGEARIFHLGPNDRLPVGWADTPAFWAEAIAEAKAEAIAPKAEAIADPLADIIAAEDKTALDEYADAKGIKLDRRKSFDKMLADYRAKA